MSMKKMLKEMRELEERFLADQPLPQAPGDQSGVPTTSVEKQDIKQTGNLLARVIGKGVEQLQDLIGMVKDSGDVDKLFGERAMEKIDEMAGKLKEVSEFFTEKKSEQPEGLPEEPKPEEEPQKVPGDEGAKLEAPEEEPEEDEEESEESEEGEESEEDEEESEEGESEEPEEDEEDKEKNTLTKSNVTVTVKNKK